MYLYEKGTTEMAGMGPVFAEISLFIPVALLALVWLIRKKKILLRDFAIMMTLFLICIFINPICWYARYVPQLWFIPLIIAFYFLYLKKFRLVAYVLLAGLTFNTWLLIDKHFSYQIKLTKTHRKILNSLKACPDPVIFPGWTSTFKLRLKEFGIHSYRLPTEADTPYIHFEGPVDAGYVECRNANSR
jgi:hypothetical protein